jgi:hypothetical protein
MFQKGPIFAPLISGVQYPDGQVKIEHLKPYGENIHREIALGVEGIFAVLYDVNSQFKGVRLLVPETEEEKKIFRREDLEEISDIYHTNLQFRA